jgi:hypothetical protein
VELVVAAAIASGAELGIEEILLEEETDGGKED